MSGAAVATRPEIESSPLPTLYRSTPSLVPQPRSRRETPHEKAQRELVRDGHYRPVNEGDERRYRAWQRAIDEESALMEMQAERRQIVEQEAGPELMALRLQVEDLQRRNRILNRCLDDMREDLQHERTITETTILLYGI